MLSRLIRAFKVSIWVLVLSGCQSASSLPTVKLTIVRADGAVSEPFTMEVASTPELRTRGLMFRRDMRSNEGMVFLFPQQQRLTFWMKNTFIPLDMVFVATDWTVVGVVENAAPQTETPRYIDGNSQYVLEFTAGTAQRLGVAPGSRVRVDGSLPPIL